MTNWRVVISKKPARAGEAFILRDGGFVIKIYKDSCPKGAETFAIWLATQLNHVEDRKQERLKGI